MSKSVLPGLPTPAAANASKLAHRREHSAPYPSPAAARQRSDIRSVIGPAMQRNERQFQQAGLSRWVKAAIRRMNEEGCHILDVAPGYALACALDDVVNGCPSDLLTPEHPKKGKPASNEDWFLWVHIELVIELVLLAAPPNSMSIRSAIGAAIHAMDAEIKRLSKRPDLCVMGLMPGSGREPPNAVHRGSEQSQQQVAHDRFVNRCLERRANLINCQGLPGGKAGQIALMFAEYRERLKCPNGLDPAAHFASERDYVAAGTACLLLGRRRHSG